MISDDMLHLKYSHVWLKHIVVGLLVILLLNYGLDFLHLVVSPPPRGQRHDQQRDVLPLPEGGPAPPPRDAGTAVMFVVYMCGLHLNTCTRVGTCLG